MFDCLHGSNGLKLCHLNIASLYVKIDEIRDIFAYTDVYVFSFNETYLVPFLMTRSIYKISLFFGKIGTVMEVE